MYWTEEEGTEKQELENEDQCDREFDETKISSLLHRAYRRLKKEDSEERRIWDEAIRTIREGDHYLLTLWDLNPWPLLPTASFWKLLGGGILLLIVVMAVFVAVVYNNDSKPDHPNATGSWPPWIQHLLLGSLIFSYLAFALFPKFWSEISLRLTFRRRKENIDDVNKSSVQ